MDILTKDNKEFFEKSEIIKNKATQLFEGQDPCISVFGLMHAASIILKESGKDYLNAVVEASTILFHLEDCQGCNKND